jgi:hypothetical protein
MSFAEKCLSRFLLRILFRKNIYLKISIFKSSTPHIFIKICHLKYLNSAPNPKTFIIHYHFSYLIINILF